MEHISKVLDKISRQVITPIETGVKYLDSTIGGYYPGEVTTIVERIVVFHKFNQRDIHMRLYYYPGANIAKLH